MRFYDKQKRTEVHEENENTIPYTDESVAFFFRPIPDGFRLEFSEDGLPIKTQIPEMTPDELTSVKKKKRKHRLNTILTKKVNGIKALAINQPDITDPDAVAAQKEIYDNFYNAAKNGTFGTDEENKAVINAHDEAEAMALSLTKIANKARQIISKKINNGEDDVDALLDYVENIKLTKDELTPKKLNKIKQVLGV